MVDKILFDHRAVFVNDAFSTWEDIKNNVLINKLK